MRGQPYIIQGGIHTDTRGFVSFVNDFNLEGMKRFYVITHLSESVIRAWQGHRYETKCFYCLQGVFDVRLIKIDDWENPSSGLPVSNFRLSDDTSSLLLIPPGFVNGFRALATPSRLLVFSDKTTGESQADDYRFRNDYWFTWEKV